MSITNATLKPTVGVPPEGRSADIADWRPEDNEFCVCTGVEW